ncbi:hypothetical protein [Antrihabitans spumae]|jgi:hypothetical protein|uniref:Uncharacterized protein n=1 Tax=Antrihabitans spumae TaxID=3373370 RepID=A0ABW7JTY9_9NOCA
MSSFIEPEAWSAPLRTASSRSVDDRYPFVVQAVVTLHGLSDPRYAGFALTRTQLGEERCCSGTVFAETLHSFPSDENRQGHRQRKHDNGGVDHEHHQHTASHVR